MTVVGEGDEILQYLESEERFRPLASFFAKKGLDELLQPARADAEQLRTLAITALNLVSSDVMEQSAPCSSLPSSRSFVDR